MDTRPTRHAYIVHVTMTPAPTGSAELDRAMPKNTHREIVYVPHDAAADFAEAVKMVPTFWRENPLGRVVTYRDAEGREWNRATGAPVDGEATAPAARGLFLPDAEAEARIRREARRIAEGDSAHWTFDFDMEHLVETVYQELLYRYGYDSTYDPGEGEA